MPTTRSALGQAGGDWGVLTKCKRFTVWSSLCLLSGSAARVCRESGHLNEGELPSFWREDEQGKLLPDRRRYASPASWERSAYARLENALTRIARARGLIGPKRSFFPETVTDRLLLQRSSTESGLPQPP